MFNHKHRVVVQLTDDGSEIDIHESIAAALSPRSRKGKIVQTRNLKANVDVLDEKTLLLRVKNDMQSSKPSRSQEMHFDCVGTHADQRTSSEISSLIDQLLVQCHNCCLLKFSPMKLVSQVPFICNHLVNEMEKRFQMLRTTVNSITIEYFDIQKYDMVNLITDGTKKRRRPYIRTQFNNILELHKWFQKEYVTLWSAGVGHDCLDVHFLFVDIKHHVHKVKLSLFNLYLSKMDLDAKNVLCDFFQNLGTDKPIKPCLLTDCLKEYFADNKTWRTWMIFDVPLLKFAGNVTDDMLKLANAAYIGTRMTDKKKSLEISIIDSDIFHSKMETKIFPKNQVIGDGAHYNKKSKNTLNSNLSLSSKDFNSLSSWYCKVDEKYASAMSAMELYYSRKYEMKTRQICGDIKLLARTIDQYEKVPDAESIKNSLAERDLQTSFAHYEASLLAFRNLTREIERCSYCELLKVYLKTKNYELTKQALRLKIQQLEICQQRLSGTISDEVNALNILKKTAPLSEASENATMTAITVAMESTLASG